MTEFQGEVIKCYFTQVSVLLKANHNQLIFIDDYRDYQADLIISKQIVTCFKLTSLYYIDDVFFTFLNSFQKCLGKLLCGNLYFCPYLISLRTCKFIISILASVWVAYCPWEQSRRATPTTSKTREAVLDIPAGISTCRLGTC